MLKDFKNHFKNSFCENKSVHHREDLRGILRKVSGLHFLQVFCNYRIDRPLEMTSNAWQKRGNLLYAITYVIWANQTTESFKYHRLQALEMFDVTSFPAILSGIRRHLKFYRYGNYLAFHVKEIMKAIALFLQFYCMTMY